MDPSKTKTFSSAEELLKAQTVGLVKFSDFRKRRAAALEITEVQEKRSKAQKAEGTDQSAGSKVTKKKKKPAKVNLSFNIDEDDEEDSNESRAEAKSGDGPAAESNLQDQPEPTKSTQPEGQNKRRLGPNASVPAPRDMTKIGLIKEAQERERLRREFLQIQERVKETEIAIPFVFFDGSVHTGGKCVVKKGDNVWLFLDKARKLAAGLGVGGERKRKEWARVGVDDLILVRGDMILPHHYEFYYFMSNKSVGYHGRLFDMSAEPTEFTPGSTAKEKAEDPEGTKYDPLDPAKSERKVDIELLEGAQDSSALTRVVDRRWYDRNKHLFPASLWEEFDPTKDYTKGVRTDSEGNSFFRS